MARRVAILAVGDEILAGELVDTNSRWLARTLRARGHVPVSVQTAGDDVASIARSVARAAQDADLLLVTGGLGPTNDDLTRDGIAAAFGVGLAERPELLPELEALYARHGRTVGAGSRRQIEIPIGARVLPNAHGTAPGFCLAGRVGGRPLLVASLPGVPTEMRAMATAFLDAHVPDDVAHATVRLLACGLAESEVGERIADLMDHAAGAREDLRVGITVSRGVISVTLRGTDAAAITRLAADVRARLGEACFGAGEELTLAGHVVATLAARRLTVTTAESCTGGLLAGEITSVPGSSAVFRQGVVTYEDGAKSRLLGVPAALLAAHGAVSEEVARAMAEGARERAGADCALALSGVAGPDGGTPDKPVGTVCVALADAAGTRAWTRQWKGTREEVRTRSVTFALDALRRRLLPG